MATISVNSTLSILITTPTILLPGLCPTDTLMHVGKDVGRVLHTTAQFVTAEDWNNPNVYQQGIGSMNYEAFTQENTQQLLKKNEEIIYMLIWNHL